MTERNTDVSKTLTEQWKKGKLPEGDYYIKRRNGDTPYDNIDSHGVWRNSIDEDIVEVLAEVPSYEQWSQTYKTKFEFLEEIIKLKKQLDHVTRTQAKQFRDNQKLQVKAEHAKDVVNIDTARQIKQLKELLRECREHLITYKRDDLDKGYVVYDGSYLIDKISQVLGEE